MQSRQRHTLLLITLFFAFSRPVEPLVFSIEGIAVSLVKPDIVASSREEVGVGSCRIAKVIVCDQKEERRGYWG